MSDVSYDYGGRVVAVTGAATGIGRATAAAFAEAGATVLLLDVDDEAGLESASGVGQFVHCDVTSAEDVDAAFERITADPGRLDVLVNNAGGFWAQRTTTDLPLEEWHRVIAAKAGVHALTRVMAAEVASWILYLASEEAGFITGQTISVNGGRHMAHETS